MKKKEQIALFRHGVLESTIGAGSTGACFYGEKLLIMIVISAEWL